MPLSKLSLVLARPAALLYLTTIEVPTWLTRQVVRQLRERGVYVGVRRVRLSLFEGVIAKGSRFYDAPGARQPVLEAGRIAFRVHPFE